ncbi:MAG: bifunctional metallophosphatase/5'-nucleotidase [Lachnospiraceae bacterium]|nr:bifunctional metallophosphatase/5'-nucleotidase [Lachnospiraceae bacterium]
MKKRTLDKYIKLLLAAVLVCTCLISCGKAEPQTAQTEPQTTESAQTEISSETDSQTESTEKSEETTAAREARILVIETTDIHGNIIEASSGNPDTFQYRLAYIAKAINDARASGEYDDVLLLDGGDLYQGPPISDLLDGAPIRAAIDAMDYDAVCLGNHEFDWDVTGLCADADGTVAPYELDEYKGDPDIPIVAANLYDAATGERVPFTRDYVLVQKAGKKIAVVGYLPDYSDDIKVSKIAPYKIDKNTERFNELVKEINEKESPDMTVVLAHDQPGPLAEALDPGQGDLVLGGHSHEIAADTASNGIPYIQGNSKAQGYASAVMVIGTDGTVKAEDIKYTSITDNKEILYDSDENLANFDETILDISYVAWNKVWEDMSEVVGFVDVPVLKDRKDGVSTAANFLTSIMLRAVKEDGTVAAFYNYGGVRTSFKIPSGEYTRQITVYDIYSIVPFGNAMLLYDVTGAELARLLEQGLKDSSYGDIMSGLTFTYSYDGKNYKILSITLDDGREVGIEDNETIYRICISDYCATKPGSIFEGKEPVFPAVEAMTEHDLIISQLRKERDAGDGYIPVDTGARGVETGE